MKESIKISVTVDGDEKELEICYDTEYETITAYIDKQEVFGADWENIKKVFERALELWDEEVKE